jgi:mRNA interferase MazF
MAFAQGAVLVLPFPYSDRLTEKRRPAVVISKPTLERAHGLVWVAMITSPRGRPRADDVVITDIGKAIEHCGGSIPRAAKMLALSPSTVYRKLESWNGVQRRSGT